MAGYVHVWFFSGYQYNPQSCVPTWVADGFMHVQIVHGIYWGCSLLESLDSLHHKLAQTREDARKLSMFFSNLRSLAISMKSLGN